MRENLDQWDFVIAAYAVTIIAIGVLTLWSWIAMARAERKRDDARRK